MVRVTLRTRRVGSDGSEGPWSNVVVEAPVLLEEFRREACRPHGLVPTAKWPVISVDTGSGEWAELLSAEQLEQLMPQEAGGKGNGRRGSLGRRMNVQVFADAPGSSAAAPSEAEPAADPVAEPTDPTAAEPGTDEPVAKQDEKDEQDDEPEGKHVQFDLPPEQEQEQEQEQEPEPEPEQIEQEPTDPLLRVAHKGLPAPAHPGDENDAPKRGSGRGVPVGKAADQYSLELVQPSQGFSAISAGAPGLVFWVRTQEGTFGQVAPVQGAPVETLADGLARPSAVFARGHRVFVLEEGADPAAGGRLSFFDVHSRRWHVLLNGLRQPRGLFVTRRCDVLFAVRGEDRDVAVNALRGPDVRSSVPGANAHLWGRQHELLAVSNCEGLPESLVQLADGSVVLGVRRCWHPLEGGAVMAYHPTVRGAWSFSDARTLWTGLSPVRDVAASADGAELFFAGCGRDGAGRAVAIGVGGSDAALRPVWEGFATCIDVDEAGNIFFCGGVGAGSLQVLWAPGSKRAMAEARARAEAAAAVAAKLAAEARRQAEQRDAAAPRRLSKKHASLASALAQAADALQQPVTTPSAAHLDFSDGVNVQVLLRCRPLFDHERAAGAHHILSCSHNEVRVSAVASYQKPRAFTFGRVFDSDASQRTLYNEAIAPIVAQALEGFNCTVFAYGQTGSGKTYTIQGSLDSGEHAGIIPRAIHTIFERLRQRGGKYTVDVSHLEIYNEELTDLLADPEDAEAPAAEAPPPRTTSSRSLLAAARKRGLTMEYVPVHSPAAPVAATHEEGDELSDPLTGKPRRNTVIAAMGRRSKVLKLMRDPNSGGQVIVRGLEVVRVQSPAEILEILDRSVQNRKTASTLCNAVSSRSHAIFSVSVCSTTVNEAGESVTTTGRLNLVDLSGSENVKRSGAKGVRAREAATISQGLLALGRVIKALVNGSEHVPFRDSKLTRLLEDSLGGNALTTLILTASPSSVGSDETLSTLGYATLAKRVRNQPSKNQRRADGEEAEAAEKEAEEQVHTVRPWEGSVPVRARSREAAPQAERTCHLPTQEWAQRNLLTPEGGLAPRAQAVVRDVFRRFDADADDELQPEEVLALSRFLRDVRLGGGGGGEGEEEEDDDEEEDEEMELPAGTLTADGFLEFFAEMARADPLRARHTLTRTGFGLGLDKARVYKAARPPRSASVMSRQQRQKQRRGTSAAQAAQAAQQLAQQLPKTAGAVDVPEISRWLLSPRQPERPPTPRAQQLRRPASAAGRAAVAVAATPRESSVASAARPESAGGAPPSTSTRRRRRRWEQAAAQRERAEKELSYEELAAARTPRGVEKCMWCGNVKAQGTLHTPGYCC